MNEDNLRKDSELSENTGTSAADRRFDVLDSADYADLTGERAEPVAKDAEDLSLDALLDELEALGKGTSSENAAEASGVTETYDGFSAANVAEPQSTDAQNAPSEAAANAETANVKASLDKDYYASGDGDDADPLEDTGTIEFTRGTVDAPKKAPKKAEKKPAKKPASVTEKKGYTKEQVDRAALTISTLVEQGKLSSALDLVLCLRGAFRQAVREKASVTIPLGSRDADLRRIAAGALIQSYLEQGKIVRRDIEDKLYAIIESSEPEYDDDDEIIEQTPEDVLYKVTACMVFAAELTERSGKHPDEKNAMYASGDSVLDSFLADNLGEAVRTNGKRVDLLADALEASGGEVTQKFFEYYGETKSSGRSAIARFFGDSVAFKVAAGIVGLLCLITLILYVTKFPSSGLNAQIFGFVAKENGPIMIFVIMAQVFALIGMSILCVIVGFAGKTKDRKRK